MIFYPSGIMAKTCEELMLIVGLSFLIQVQLVSNQGSELLFKPLLWNSSYGVSLALRDFVSGLNGIKGLELATDWRSAPI
jgi:hypothetical protein